MVQVPPNWPRIRTWPGTGGVADAAIPNAHSNADLRGTRRRYHARKAPTESRPPAIARSSETLVGATASVQDSGTPGKWTTVLGTSSLAHGNAAGLPIDNANAVRGAMVAACLQATHMTMGPARLSTRVQRQVKDISRYIQLSAMHYLPGVYNRPIMDWTQQNRKGHAV